MSYSHIVRRRATFVVEKSLKAVFSCRFRFLNFSQTAKREIAKIEPNTCRGNGKYQVTVCDFGRNVVKWTMGLPSRRNGYTFLVATSLVPK